MDEISFNLNKIKEFFRNFYLIILISFFINLFLVIIIYNSSLMKEIDYTSVIGKISFEQENIKKFKYKKDQITAYTPTCGENVFFPVIVDIKNYNTIETINAFKKIIDFKFQNDNLYSAKNHSENYFINIVNSQSDKYLFKPLRDKYALVGFPDSGLKFYFDSNLSSLDNDYILSFLMEFRSDEVSQNVANEINLITVNFLSNMFDSMYEDTFTNNKYLMEAALNTTQNYINEILNSEGHGADPRLVNCLVRNQFNLRQINILLNSLNGNNDHKLNFKSDLKITNSSMTPSIEESFGIYIIPIIFFFLTILFCLYRFAIHKN